MIGIGIGLPSLSGNGYAAMCSSSVTTPIDTTVTITTTGVTCSTGAIEIDSVAAGNGIVIINGIWRLL